jgi:hypothetical protein
MIPIDSTSSTVVMLLVAGGVGLLGGIGAGLLEIRRDSEKAKKSANTIISSVFLGGIAAIAILYFFPPEEVVRSEMVNGVFKPIKEYDLTKLVALALIVGSAGASFLLVLQKRTLDLTDAQQEVAKKAGDAKATKATATEAVVGVANHVPTLARSSVLEGAAPTIRKALEKASSRKAAPISAEMVESVLEEVADQAEAAVERSIDPLLRDAQKRILAGPLEGDLDPVETEQG